MQKSEQFEQKIAKYPDSFELHRSYAQYLYDKAEYGYCFVVLQRAIEIYESAPEPILQNDYFSLRRLEQSLKRENMPDLIGEVHGLLARGWTPVFKHGLVRELVLQVHRGNVGHLVAGLRSGKLRKLRALSLKFEDGAQEGLKGLCGVAVTSLRALQMHFSQRVDPGAVLHFLESQRTPLSNMRIFHLRMPRIDDEHAIGIKRLLGALEYFTLHSLEREGMGLQTAYFIADDAACALLQELSLIGTQVSDRGLLALAMSKGLGKLRHLSLRDGTLSNNAGRIMSADHGFRSLRSLDVSYNQIDESGLVELRRLGLELQDAHQHKRPAGSE